MMEDRIIYLDQNILSDYLAAEDCNLTNAISEVKNKNCFVYSPAHIEELAVPFMKNSSVEVKNRVLHELDRLSDLTEDREVFPGFDKPMYIIIEAPRLCFERVIEQYDLNPILEQVEKEQLKKFKNTDVDGKKANVVSNYDESILLEEEHSLELNGRFHFDFIAAMSARKAGLRSFKYPEILKSHTTFERCIELTFNYIESIRYRPEPVKNSRSRMHDVSHAIYASMADIIVTDDKKFSKKVKAVYTYWGIDTEIYSKDSLFSEMNVFENT